MQREAAAPPPLAAGAARSEIGVGALILGFTLLRLLLAATVPLLPQEAYYWTWSCHLDWSYFDHPPLAAYGIALSTAIFGQSAFGIKAAAVAWSLGWNLLWARLVLTLFNDRRLAFWSLLVLNLTVVYQAFGIGPTPDGPLLFGWVGTVWALWHACACGDTRWWLATGAFAGVALLGKYTAVLLLPVALLFLLLGPSQRHWLRRPQPWLATLLALLLFTPVIYWNAQHDWASFVFQSGRRVGHMHGLKPRYFITLLATQSLMVTPYLFVAALAVPWQAARAWRSQRLDDASRLLLTSALVPLLLFTLVSLRSLVKINWPAPAFWPLIILAVRQRLRLGAPWRGAMLGLASSAGIVMLALAAAAVPDLPWLGDLNTWSGWQQAALRVGRQQQAMQAQGQASFVFSPSYKISSLLHFYLPGHERTYAQDIYGEPALQFDHFRARRRPGRPDRHSRAVGPAGRAPRAEAPGTLLRRGRTR